MKLFDNKGFTIAELLISIGISTVVYLAAVGILSKNKSVVDNFIKDSSFVLARGQIEKQLSVKKSNFSNCKDFFSTINFLNYSSITNTVPAGISTSKINSTLGLPLIQENYEISSVRLFGQDSAGLKYKFREGIYSTYEGLLVVRYSKGTKNIDLDPIEINFNINTKTGELIDCHPVTYEQETSFELCKIFGDDAIVDPSPTGSGECMIPIYNCYTGGSEPTLRSMIVTPPTKKTPCGWINIRDALCDIQKRSYTPFKSFCD